MQKDPNPEKPDKLPSRRELENTDIEIEIASRFEPTTIITSIESIRNVVSAAAMPSLRYLIDALNDDITPPSTKANIAIRLLELNFGKDKEDLRVTERKDNAIDTIAKLIQDAKNGHT